MRREITFGKGEKRKSRRVSAQLDGIIAMAGGRGEREEGGARLGREALFKGHERAGHICRRAAIFDDDQRVTTFRQSGHDVFGVIGKGDRTIPKRPMRMAEAASSADDCDFMSRDPLLG